MKKSYFLRASPMVSATGSFRLLPPAGGMLLHSNFFLTRLTNPSALVERPIHILFDQLTGSVRIRPLTTQQQYPSELIPRHNSAVLPPSWPSNSSSAVSASHSDLFGNQIGARLPQRPATSLPLLEPAHHSPQSASARGESHAAYRVQILAQLPILAPKTSATKKIPALLAPKSKPVAAAINGIDDDDSELGEDDDAKIPRPANAFILFRQHHHPTVKAQNPGMHNNDICK